MNKLIDRFGRVHTYLRISVTDRCNLRCVYCMPAEGNEVKAADELLTFDEILRIARIFVDMGINKIRLTGGEPLVRKGLESLIAQLSLLPGVETLAMTTNAVLLKDKVRILKGAGLTALNISLDTFKSERFFDLTRRNDLNNVLDGIYAALENNFQPLKLNVVMMKGINDDELLDFVHFAKDKPLNVRFIEYMPFKDNQWDKSGVLTYADMKRTIEQRYQLLPLSAEPSAVAKDFGIKGFTGTVSFVTSMSDSFCGTCNRLRLTADGNIKSCLFSPAEINIRDAMRCGLTDEGLANMISSAVLLKPYEHPPMETLANLNNRAMVDIGG